MVINFTTAMTDGVSSKIFGVFLPYGSILDTGITGRPGEWTVLGVHKTDVISKFYFCKI